MTSRPVHEHEDTAIDTGAPVPVTIDYVDAQLTQLWRDVAEAAQAKGGVSAVTMAQVLNLIVRAESMDVSNDYVVDIDNVTGSHPARVITMISDPEDDASPVQAWVSIHCQLPPSGGRQVCAEQIYVSSGSSSMRQVPAAVIPLLLPELPVFLWWPHGSPFDDYLFRQLVDSLNRIIVDSSTFENPEGTLAKMSTRLKSDWPKVACTDMNWGRITRWRELVAQFFDGATLRPYLDRVNQVTIEFALSKQGGPVNRAQALLVASWLASRLGWQPMNPVYDLVREGEEQNRPASARLTLHAPDRQITILLRPSEQPSDTAGDLQRIKLEVTGSDAKDGAEASFEVYISAEEDCAWTNIEVAGVSPSKRSFQMDVPNRSMLLDTELEVFSHDRIFDEALAMTGVFIRGSISHEPEGPRKIPTGEPVSSGAYRAKQTGAPPK